MISKNKFFLFLLFLLFLFPKKIFAFTDSILGRMLSVGAGAGYVTGAIPGPINIVSSIITIVLGLLGVLFIIQIILAGFKWMMAGGNEEQITHAKKRITNAAIGIAIILAAYIITMFVITQLINVTGSGGGGFGSGGG